MPRKQRRRAHNNNDTPSRSHATPKSRSGESGGGFPPYLLRGHGHNEKSDASPDASGLETLVPNAVFVARRALSTRECREWINYAEGGGGWDAVSHPATKWVAHRECGRIQKNDWNMSHRLYQRIENVIRHVSPQLGIIDEASLLERLLPGGARYGSRANANSENPPRYQPVTCNSNLRLYKYTKGQWFGRHVDESNKVDFPRNGGNNGAPLPAPYARDAQTEVTVLFYLSSCRGGATKFHLPRGKGGGGGKRRNGGGAGSAEISFVPEEGAALLHVHGDRCLEHEAEPVLEGVKYDATTLPLAKRGFGDVVRTAYLCLKTNPFGSCS